MNEGLLILAGFWVVIPAITLLGMIIWLIWGKE
jgi:hypothetical protein